MSWQLTDEQIECQYREAKDQAEQLYILADLNAVPVELMREKLVSLGFEPPKGKTKWSKPQRRRIDQELSMRLYQEGKNDHEIAAACGLTAGGVQRWRERNFLESKQPKNRKGAKKMKSEAKKAAMSVGTLREYLDKLEELCGGAQLMIDGKPVYRVAETRISAAEDTASIDLRFELGSEK